MTDQHSKPTGSRRADWLSISPAGPAPAPTGPTAGPTSGAATEPGRGPQGPSETIALLPVEPSPEGHQGRLRDDPAPPEGDGGEGEEERGQGNVEAGELGVRGGEEEELSKEDYLAVLRLRQQESSAERKQRARRQVLDWLLPRKPREYKLLAFVVVLFVIIVTAFVVVFHLHQEPSVDLWRQRGLTLNRRTLDAFIANGRGDVVLEAHLWLARPAGRLPYDCTGGAASDNTLCLTWKELQRLNVSQSERDNVTCLQVTWEALADDVTQVDCFELGAGVRWHGGGLLNNVAWPLERAVVSRQSFVTGGARRGSGGTLGPVLERYWMNSRGVTILVKDDAPLQISLNAVSELTNKSDGQFCIYSEPRSAWPPSPAVHPPSLEARSTLSYSICVAETTRRAHEANVPGFVPPIRTIDPMFVQGMLESPVWSTGALFKDSLNQTLVKDYAEGIVSRGYGRGLLMIDAGWDEAQGALHFDRSKFSDPGELVEALHASGFNISLSAHPYVSTRSATFQEAAAEGFLVRDVGGRVPGLTQWSETEDPQRPGVSGVVDFTSENASSWLMERLLRLKVDTFHFSGGDVESLSLYPSLSEQLGDLNEFTRRGCQFAAGAGARGALPPSAQAAHRCQGARLLVRLAGAESDWGATGLAQVVPTTLALSLIGYPIFIPDPIGGSGCVALGEALARLWAPPSKELYIRWMQVSAFLPIMHFSIPPDRYDDETVGVALEMLRIREQVVVPEIKRLLGDTLSKLHPLLRPLWWSSAPQGAPLPSELFDETQFLLGDNVLVAPVLRKGAVVRDVYIPRGHWEDQRAAGGGFHIGPKQLVNYSVPLGKVAFFIRKDLP